MEYERLSGTISNMARDMSHGYIHIEGEQNDLFFFASKAPMAKPTDLVKGVEVRFSIGKNARGPMAINIELASVAQKIPSLIDEIRDGQKDEAKEDADDEGIYKKSSRFGEGHHGKYKAMRAKPKHCSSMSLRRACDKADYDDDYGF